MDANKLTELKRINSYLRTLGYSCELIDGKVNSNHHCWLKVDDIIVDPTADQFKKPNGARMPKIYVGEKPKWYKEQ